MSFAAAKWKPFATVQTFATMCHARVVPPISQFGLFLFLFLLLLLLLLLGLAQVIHLAFLFYGLFVVNLLESNV